ncbi:MAG TPA: transcription antitermination factor NusB [Bryobacteraceae bacterium]|nr:transcription antitermination factor NusB [Bryobacteraceae bacterium]
MSATVSPARLLAFDTLRKVGRGGYASDLLASAGPLDPRDTALASEIVFGVLRYQAQLDFLIQHCSGRPVPKLDFEVLLALRLGVYQLRYLDRIPPHAAVGQSVELVKSAGFRSAAGFANAVLRKVGREAIAWPDRAVELSLPHWLLDRWDREFGAATTTLIAHANLRATETYIRIPRDRAIPPGITVDPTEIPGCYRLVAGEAGRFRIQDIGSQAVVPLLDLASGQTFLDLCAAPGNKTAQALEYGVRAVACDFHPKRVDMLRSLGVNVVHLDGTRPLPFGRRFDRILLDAPCSGTGTLARNPEIKWRLEAADIQELHRRQVVLLRNALDVLAPGGVLVYSTCSLEREENDGVLEALGLNPERIMRRIPGIQPGDGFFAAVLRSR